MDVAELVLPPAALGPCALGRFSQAATDWIREGATWVDLPWVVPPEFTAATRPVFAFGRDVHTPHGSLVASGEQAFLWLDAQSTLPCRCLIGWTPCFRDEPKFDPWHQYGFIKLEAYQPLLAASHPQTQLSAFVNRAQAHFERWAGRHVRQRWFPEGSADIELNGHEVGSYGVREHPMMPGRRYIYGTVLAEPRFSTALASTTSSSMVD